MDSRPELDASTDAVKTSTETSHASPIDLYPSATSARSSVWMPDYFSNSSRTSYSSDIGSLNRISSFSRTSCELSLDSEESFPSSPADSSPDISFKCQDTQETNRFGGAFHIRLHFLTKHVNFRSDSTPPKSPSENQLQDLNKPALQDGPSALRALQQVQNILCVAFGAFDRYYISWEDTEGKFHQGTALDFLTLNF